MKHIPFQHLHTATYPCRDFRRLILWFFYLLLFFAFLFFARREFILHAISFNFFRIVLAWMVLNLAASAISTILFVAEDISALNTVAADLLANRSDDSVMHAWKYLSELRCAMLHSITRADPLNLIFLAKLMRAAGRASNQPALVSKGMELIVLSVAADPDLAILASAPLHNVADEFLRRGQEQNSFFRLTHFYLTSAAARNFLLVILYGFLALFLLVFLLNLMK